MTRTKRMTLGLWNSSHSFALLSFVSCTYLAGKWEFTQAIVRPPPDFILSMLWLKLTFAIFSFRIVQGHFLGIYLHNWVLCAWRCQGGREKSRRTIWSRELQRILSPAIRYDTLRLCQVVAIGPIFFGWLVCFKSSSPMDNHSETKCREASNYVRIKPLSMMSSRC